MPDSPAIAVLRGAVAGFTGIAVRPADEPVDAVDDGWRALHPVQVPSRMAERGEVQQHRDTAAGHGGKVQRVLNESIG